MNQHTAAPVRWAPTHTLRLLVGLALLCAVTGRALAQGPTAAPSGAPTGTPESDLADKRRAVAAEIADARTRAGAAGGDDRAANEKHVSLLERIAWLLDQQAEARQRAADLQQAQARATQELQSVRATGLEQKPPYSIAMLDDLRDQLVDTLERGKNIDAHTRAADEALAQARATYGEAESARRQAKEAFETNGDPSQAPALEQALRWRQLESRLAGETVALYEVQAADEHLSRQVNEAEADTLNEKIARMAKQTRLTRDALKEQLVRLDKEGSDIAQTLESAKLEQPALDRNWSKARQRLDATPGGDAALAEEVEARRLAQQTGQLAVTVAGNRLERNRERKDGWNRRFELASGSVGREQRAAWEQETRQLLEQLEREQRLEQSRLAETREAIGAAEKAAAAAPDSRGLREQQRQLEERGRLYQADLADLDATRLLYLKLQEDLRSQRESLPLTERVGNAWDGVRSAWRYELTAVDDRPITVGKVVTGLVLIALGLWVSRLVSHLLGRRVFPRMGLNAGAAAALQSLSFYLLVCLLSLLALRVINVPLTVFTILGGALAIGVGFGSQNVVNNFISGLILLAERPIKVGDLVEIDGAAGEVEHIGARSTRLRSPNNTDVIVPNSAFLEKKLINWTLSDDHARLQIRVGVAYGSAPHEVAQLIRKAVDDHPRVLRYPEPIVLFADFGDSALVFDAHFWLRVRGTMDGRMVESDIRYRIDELFRAQNIVIAHPQRDLHLETARPLEIRVVAPRDGEEQ